MTNERWNARCALLSVDPHLLVRIFSGEPIQVVANPLPPDTKLVEAFWDAPRGTWMLKVWSATYPENPEGTRYPEITPPLLASLNVAGITPSNGDGFYEVACVDDMHGNRRVYEVRER